MRESPEVIAKARECLTPILYLPSGRICPNAAIASDEARLAARVLLSATAPLTNEELAGIMADYCVDVLKVETDRAQIVASYMRDMESTDGHSHSRMMRYLADRLFGKVKT